MRFLGMWNTPQDALEIGPEGVIVMVRYQKYNDQAKKLKCTNVHSQLPSSPVSHQSNIQAAFSFSPLKHAVKKHRNFDPWALIQLIQIKCYEVMIGFFPGKIVRIILLLKPWDQRTDYNQQGSR